MLQQDQPKDYVIATGLQSSVREFIELCAKKLDWVLSGKDLILTKRVIQRMVN